jgi:hypothetical protein
MIPRGCQKAGICVKMTLIRSEYFSLKCMNSFSNFGVGTLRVKSRDVTKDSGIITCHIYLSKD